MRPAHRSSDVRGSGESKQAFLKIICSEQSLRAVGTKTPENELGKSLRQRGIFRASLLYSTITTQILLDPQLYRTQYVPVSVEISTWQHLVHRQRVLEDYHKGNLSQSKSREFKHRKRNCHHKIPFCRISPENFPSTSSWLQMREWGLELASQQRSHLGFRRSFVACRQTFWGRSVAGGARMQHIMGQRLCRR